MMKFVAALLTVAKSRNNLCVCPIIHGKITKLVCTHNGVLFSCEQEIQIHTGWTLKTSVPSEINQSQIGKHCVISCTQGMYDSQIHQDRK